MATAPDLYNNTKILNKVYDPNTNTLATSSATGEGAIINPSPVTLDMIYANDIDWENSDFTGWIGDPMDLFGNVNNGGIYNDSTDNPKVFTLRLIRTRQTRTFGIGTSIGSFSNVKVTVLGSSDVERGVLDLSYEASKQQSMVYAEEEFAFNSLRVEFFTTDRVDVTNLFLEHTSSDRKQDYIHKFGLNIDVDTDTFETIWTLGDIYIFTETPQNYYISSSSATDVTQEIVVETIGINTEGKYQRETNSVIVDGQNKVIIPTDFLCIASNRAFNNSNTPLIGDIYIYEDTTITGGVPDDLSKVRSVISATREQTEQAVYTVPEITENGNLVAFAELYRWNCSAITNKDASGLSDLIVAPKDKVKRVQSSRGLSNSYESGQDFGENTPLIIQPGSDISVQVYDVSVNNTAVQAGFTIKLVIL